MIVTIPDVAENFDCDFDTATKITNFLLKASNVSMAVKNIVDFRFCGVRYALCKTGDEWVMIRSTAARSENIDDILE